MVFGFQILELFLFIWYYNFLVPCGGLGCGPLAHTLAALNRTAAIGAFITWEVLQSMVGCFVIFHLNLLFILKRALATLKIVSRS